MFINIQKWTLHNQRIIKGLLLLTKAKCTIVAISTIAMIYRRYKTTVLSAREKVIMDMARFDWLLFTDKYLRAN